MKFFRRKDEDDNSFSTIDELGEWLIIRKNSNLSLLREIIEKTMKRLKVKDWDFYLIYYSEDEKIRELFTIKSMLIFPENIRELDFYNAFKNSLLTATTGDMRISRLRACNKTFLFFSTDVLVKKNLKVEDKRTKMLLPPRGVHGYEIPYVMKDLFTKITERTIESTCDSVSISLSNENFESVYHCKPTKELDINMIKDTFSYFSVDEPKVSLKTTSPRSVEIQVNISKFKTRYLIPLLWSNVLASNIVC